ncbi:glycoside hydrolase family 88 protein [Erysipelothrix sp. Poltava]|nr:glycoside hydrolase family 88 protein [Erysipelothrix sp. Poltava]
MEKHIKQVTIEPIRDIDIFKNATLLTKEEVKQAIEDTIKKIDLNMEHIGERFPWSATKDLKYPIIDNIEWTDGFWTGLLWLAYEYTGDEKYREARR